MSGLTLMGCDPGQVPSVPTGATAPGAATTEAGRAGGASPIVAGPLALPEAIPPCPAVGERSGCGVAVRLGARPTPHASAPTLATRMTTPMTPWRIASACQQPRTGG